MQYKYFSMKKDNPFKKLPRDNVVYRWSTLVASPYFWLKHSVILTKYLHQHTNLDDDCVAYLYIQWINDYIDSRSQIKIFQHKCYSNYSKGSSLVKLPVEERILMPFCCLSQRWIGL